MCPEVRTCLYSIVNLEHLISISKVDTFKFWDQCLIPQLMFIKEELN